MQPLKNADRELIKSHDLAITWRFRYYFY